MKINVGGTTVEVSGVRCVKKIANFSDNFNLSDEFFSQNSREIAR
jgi:hypothetical protein